MIMINQEDEEGLYTVHVDGRPIVCRITLQEAVQIVQDIQTGNGTKMTERKDKQ